MIKKILITTCLLSFIIGCSSQQTNHVYYPELTTGKKHIDDMVNVYLTMVDRNMEISNEQKFKLKLFQIQYIMDNRPKEDMFEFVGFSNKQISDYNKIHLKETKIN